MKKGQKMTIEQRQRMSEAKKIHASLDLPNCKCINHGKRSYRLGMKHTEESKKKIGESTKNRFVK